MTSREKKTPRPGGVISTETSNERNTSVPNSLPSPTDDFDAKFKLSTARQRVWVMPQTTPDGQTVVELSDDADSHMLLEPSEAIAVGAALQTIGGHLLEEQR